jgi:hypothetical protein
MRCSIRRKFLNETSSSSLGSSKEWNTDHIRVVFVAMVVSKHSFDIFFVFSIKTINYKTTIGTGGLNCGVVLIVDILIIAYTIYYHGLIKSFCMNKQYVS